MSDDTLSNRGAYDLIKTALESKAIQLLGSHSSGSVPGAEERAKMDAAYLTTLFAELKSTKTSKP